MFSTPQELLEFVAAEGIEYVDCRFCDLFGVQQHFNIPSDVVADALEDGLMFDGSSIRGFKAIHESDMKLVADVSTAYVDPFREAKTLIVVFSIVDPITDEAYSRDPRQVAAKAEAYLREMGLADTCYIGAEAEFFIFDEIRFNTEPDETFYSIKSSEGAWQIGKEEEGGNLGNKLPHQGWVLPRGPGRPVRRTPQQNVKQLARGGPEDRACSPRGRIRRPAGNQLPLCEPHHSRR